MAKRGRPIGSTARFCKRGHSLEDVGRDPNTGHCNVCRQEYQLEYYATLKADPDRYSERIRKSNEARRIRRNKLLTP